MMGSLANTCYQTALGPSLLSLFGLEYFAINCTSWCTDVQYSVLLCLGGGRKITCILVNCCLPILIAEFAICVFIAAHDTGTSFVHPDIEQTNPFTVNEHRLPPHWWVYICSMGKSS